MFNYSDLAHSFFFQRYLRRKFASKQYSRSWFEEDEKYYNNKNKKSKRKTKPVRNIPITSIDMSEVHPVETLEELHPHHNTPHIEELHPYHDALTLKDIHPDVFSKIENTIQPVHEVSTPHTNPVQNIENAIQLAKEEELIKNSGSKLKNRLTKFVNLMKAHPGATAAGVLGLTGLGVGARKGLIPGFSKPSLSKKVLNTIKRNKGLAAFGLLGAAGGAYALSNRDKNKKRAFDIDDLLEKYYNL
jgi:hypothetical protein